MFTFFGDNVPGLAGTPKPYRKIRTFDWGRKIKIIWLKFQNKSGLGFNTATVEYWTSSVPNADPRVLESEILEIGNQNEDFV